MAARGYRERVPGGRAAGHSPGDFDPRQLAIGTKVEMEHTSDPAVAREIAMDHLTEDPDYYTKLATIHLDGTTGRTATMRYQNVGIAPGTTTIHIGPTGTPELVGLGTVYPTDFDKAKIYGYLPVTTGWLPGHLSMLSAPGDAPSAYSRLSTAEKLLLILGGAVTVTGAVVGLMKKPSLAKTLIGLGGSASAAVIGFGLAHHGRARAVLDEGKICDPDPATADAAKAAHDSEADLEAFDVIAGSLLSAGALTALMLIRPSE